MVKSFVFLCLASSEAADLILRMGDCAEETATGFALDTLGKTIRYESRDSKVSGCLAPVEDSCCHNGEFVAIVPCNATSSLQDWIPSSDDRYGFGPSVTLQQVEDWGLVEESSDEQRLWLYNVKNFAGYCKSHKNCAFELEDGTLRNSDTGRCAHVVPAPPPTPPTPSPPTPPPPPPTPPPVVPFALAPAFGSDMVLQREPAKAAIYGTVGDSLSVKVTIEGPSTNYTVDATVKDGAWKALLEPTAAGGDWTITVFAGNNKITMSRVLFGDVWYCGGQSNMALPLVHTMHRNISAEAIKAGKYANVRLHGIRGNMNPDQEWATPISMVSESSDGKRAACPADNCQFYSFSSTCWYYAESLVDELGDDSLPIGMIHTSYGGSSIEQWLSNETIATCQNTSAGSDNAKWHVERVIPYKDMTLKGWVWYQGENNMHGVHGNSELGYGYGCMMPALVSSWRSLWSAEVGTTDPIAPFGLVTLAASGTEGGRSMGAMVWAQTANYGVLPNPAMPNTFLAQAFDLDDPFGNITCYKAKCCPNNYDPTPRCWDCYGSNGYCENLTATNYYMGPIHPRDKKPVGNRLATAAAVVAYGKVGPHTGPTISGCRVVDGKVLVTFNASLLGSDRVIVQDYRAKKIMSSVDVLVNSSLFCLQTTDAGKRNSQCIDDGTGRDIGQGPFDEKNVWVSVDIKVAGAHSISVDLSSTGGVAFGLRYAWGGDCCVGRPNTGEPCPIASCPVHATSGLPANPFIARIEDGKCKCVSPQSCDESQPEEFV